MNVGKGGRAQEGEGGMVTIATAFTVLRMQWVLPPRSQWVPGEAFPF